jgi:hypothetical protein
MARGDDASGSEPFPMTKTEIAPTPLETPVPAAATSRRRAKDYLVPPIVVPLALSMAILLYVLLRGPV